MTGKAWSDYINTIVQTVHYFKLSGVPALNLFKGLPQDATIRRNVWKD